MILTSFLMASAGASIATDFAAKFFNFDVIKNGSFDSRTKDAIQTVLNDGLYHVTSEEALDKIFDSGKLYSSSVFISYGRKKCFFFCGKPSIDALVANVAREGDVLSLTKRTAVKIKPTLSDLSQYNIRKLSDNAFSFNGDCTLEDKQASKAYLILKLIDGKLQYVEVSKMEYDNYIADDLVKKELLKAKYSNTTVRYSNSIVDDIKNTFKNALSLNKSKYSLFFKDKTSNTNEVKDFFIEFSKNMNYMGNFDMDKDYQRKKKIFAFQSKNFSDIKQYEIKNFTSDFNRLHIEDEINRIKEDVQHKSLNHGLSHSIKVLTYGMLIADHLGFSREEMQIIKDACKYHDIGRVSGITEDSKHGSRSAINIDSVVADNPFYNDPNNLNMLKAVIEMHSYDEHKYEESFARKYNINREEFKKLYSVLKDADALDRVRLSINIPYLSDLNVTYLRNDFSKSLVQLSHQLNFSFHKLFRRQTFVNETLINKERMLDQFAQEFNRVQNSLSNEQLSDYCEYLANMYNLTDKEVMKIYPNYKEYKEDTVKLSNI